MESEKPAWGIEPVPERLRTLGGLDTTLLWSSLGLSLIAAAASALSEQVFGFRGEWLWKLVAAAATTALALLGPVDFVRRWVKRFAIWVVIASLGYLTWWALRHAHLSTLWSQPGKG